MAGGNKNSGPARSKSSITKRSAHQIDDFEDQWDGSSRKQAKITKNRHSYNLDINIPLERVRGRPRGHNRTPISREEQLARNAIYERERRAELAAGWKLLGAEMNSNAPQKKLIGEAAPFVKKLEHKMLTFYEERQRLHFRNVALQAKLAKLQAKLPRVKKEPKSKKEKIAVNSEGPMLHSVKNLHRQIEMDSSEVVIDGECHDDDAIYFTSEIQEVHSSANDVRLFPSDVDDDLPIENVIYDAIDVRPREVDVIGIICSANGEERSDMNSSSTNFIDPLGEVKEEVDSGVHSPEIQDLNFLSEDEQAYLDYWAKMEIPDATERKDVSPSHVHNNLLNDQDRVELDHFDRLVEHYLSRRTT